MYRDRAQRDFARALRNEPTAAEKRLWRLLRAEQLAGHKFRRQARAPSAADGRGPYIVDFVCFSHKLIIELDGPQHLERESADHDTRRTQWLTSRGFRVMRFRNQELDEDIQSVALQIENALARTMQSPLPNPPREGEGTKP